MNDEGVVSVSQVRRFTPVAVTAVVAAVLLSGLAGCAQEEPRNNTITDISEIDGAFTSADSSGGNAGTSSNNNTGGTNANANTTVSVLSPDDVLTVVQQTIDASAIPADLDIITSPTADLSNVTNGTGTTTDGTGVALATMPLESGSIAFASTNTTTTPTSPIAITVVPDTKTAPDSGHQVRIDAVSANNAPIALRCTQPAVSHATTLSCTPDAPLPTGDISLVMTVMTGTDRATQVRLPFTVTGGN